MTIKEIQNILKREGYKAFFLKTADPHMSEYFPDHYNFIEKLTGFSGSLAQIIITEDTSLLFVDGRYHLQAEKECPDLTVMKWGLKDVPNYLEYLNQNFNEEDLICTDFRLLDSQIALNIKAKLNHLPIFENSPNNDSKIFKLSEKYTGLNLVDKLNILREIFKDKNYLITNLDAIAYSLNLRAMDIPHTPVFYAFFIYLNHNFYLFLNEAKLSNELRNELISAGIRIFEYDYFYEFLQNISDDVILADFNQLNYHAYNLLVTSNKLIHLDNPIDHLKAIKNEKEIEGMKLAHLYDGASVVRLLKWLDESDKEGLDEVIIADKLLEFRLANKAIDSSFDTIAGYNANGAIIHYHALKESCAKLKNEGILLLDSGAQYPFGTTDITRTIALGNVTSEMKKHYTIVLAAFIELSKAIFLEKTKPMQLDILARKEVYKYGLDYRHGTGHGVGMALSVHESPPNFAMAIRKTTSVDLKEGMIFSNEPGLYFDNKYGIRLENLLYVEKKFESEYGTFYGFNHLTYVPFDLNLIDVNYLNKDQIDYLNDYHKEVYHKLESYLNDEEKEYLMNLTRSL